MRLLAFEEHFVLAKDISASRQRRPSSDPSGRLQVVECADDATGVRIFAVYEGLTVLRLCTTREQSFVFVQRFLTEAAWRDPDPNGAT